jgi:cytochrome c oxidase assembly protein subunit 15
MFLFPPSMWIGGIFYEHTHRLLGTLVGLLAFTTASIAFGPSRFPLGRKITGSALILSLLLTAASIIASLTLHPANPDLAKSLPHLPIGFGSLALFALIAFLSRNPAPRPATRYLALACLLAVILQGIAGGLRVELVNIELAIAHGVFGQLTLCLIASLVLITSPRWTSAPDLSRSPLAPHGQKIANFATLAFFVVFAQLILGALMRHLGAGLAIPDLPLAYGHLLPPTTPAELDAANAARIALHDPALKPVTLPQIYLHFAHRMGALVVSAVLLHLTIKVFLRARHLPSLLLPAAGLLLLLAAQITLGLLTVYFRKPADITTLHHSVGALILLLTFTLALSARRLFSSKPQPQPSLAPPATLPTIPTPI